jgi:hypothetical protein
MTTSGSIYQAKMPSIKVSAASGGSEAGSKGPDLELGGAMVASHSMLTHQNAI